MSLSKRLSKLAFVNNRRLARNGFSGIRIERSIWVSRLDKMPGLKSHTKSSESESEPIFEDIKPSKASDMVRTNVPLNLLYNLCSFDNDILVIGCCIGAIL